MFQTCILIPSLHSFFIEHDKVCSKMKQKVLERFHPSLPTTPPSEMNVADLQSQFLQMLQTVMNAFEQLPDSLSRLKQFFSQLVLKNTSSHTVSLYTAELGEVTVCLCPHRMAGLLFTWQLMKAKFMW